jgi:hypothetical protein
MFAMKCSNISHAVGVVSGNMTKLGEEHGNECFSVLEAQKHKYHLQWLHDLLCGYVDSKDLDKKRPTSGYVSDECKDLLGKFGQVHDTMFCGGRSIVHLTNRPTYQNGTMHHFARHAIDGGGVVHTEASCVDMFMKPALLETLHWSVASLGLQKR